MSAKKHHVELAAEQRRQVEKVARSNQHSIRERVRARILLAVDAAQPGGGQKEAEAARTAGRRAVTVAYVRARFVRGALEATLHHREQARRKRRKPGRGGRGTPRGAGVRCAARPGRKRGSLPLLADQRVAAGFCEDLSHETVRQTLKKNALKPWLKKGGCIPPKANAEFVACRQDARAVYHRPQNPARALVCLDEASKQRLGEGRAPLPTHDLAPIKRLFRTLCGSEDGRG